MQGNPQNRFICSTNVKVNKIRYCLEFIEHDDNHVLLYINGMKTDCYIRRVLSPERYKYQISSDPYNLHLVMDELMIGKSRYNRDIVNSIFDKYAAEYRI